MSLGDRLEALKAIPESKEPAGGRVAAPSGWEPGVRYEPNGSAVITTPPMPENDSADEALATMGMTLPAGWRARLVEAKFDPAAWTRDEAFRVHPQTNRAVKAPAVTKPVWRYRWIIEEDPRAVPADDLIAAIGKRKLKTVTPVQVGTEFVCAGYETQWGKIDQGGSEQILANLFASHEKAVASYREHRKRGRADNVTLALVGDCLENGNVSQGGAINQAGRIDMTLSQQFRVYRRTLQQMVMDWLDYTERLTIAVVGGNHDNVERQGKIERNVRDSWALEGAVAVADAMADRHGDRIAWIFPQPDEVSLTFTVAGTQIGLIHGHQTKGKMREYVANHALSREAFGGSDVILSGHYHHLKVDQIGPHSIHIQTPALEGGSDWYRHSTGLSSPSGNVTFLTRDGAWNWLEVV